MQALISSGGSLRNLVGPWVLKCVNHHHHHHHPLPFLAQGPRWTSYLHRGLEPMWNLMWSNQVSVGAFSHKTSSFLRVAIVVLYRLWNLELGESPFVSLLWADSERIQWKFVGAGCQEKQDTWKREGCAHQAIGQATVQWCPGGEQPGEKLVNVKKLHAQIAAVSKALAELELSLMTPRSRLAELKARLHGARPIGQQVDGLRGVISKCQKRRGSGNCQSGRRSYFHQGDRGHRELPGPTRGTRTAPCFICGVSQGRWTGQWDARVASKHSIINRQTRAGEQQYRQRGSCAIPSRSAGPSTSANPTRCTAEWNTGQYNRHVRRVEPREQARGQRRLATEHEQSAARNEDDERRDAASRGHQGSPSGSVARLMIATINVTSAASRGGATKAHIPETGGLNITGRMAELDYLFSEADLDIIGVQESRLPQTQILQTRDFTVFNSGAPPGKNHYDMQQWIKKRHKSREAVNPSLTT